MRSLKMCIATLAALPGTFGIMGSGVVVTYLLVAPIADTANVFPWEFWRYLPSFSIVAGLLWLFKVVDPLITWAAH